MYWSKGYGWDISACEVCQIQIILVYLSDILDKLLNLLNKLTVKLAYLTDILVNLTEILGYIIYNIYVSLYI